MICAAVILIALIILAILVSRMFSSGGIEPPKSADIARERMGVRLSAERSWRRGSRK